MLSFDLMDALHGLTQSVWDVRRVISWVRTQSPTGILLGELRSLATVGPPRESSG